MRYNDCLRVSEEVLPEQKKRAKRERAAEKCRKSPVINIVLRDWSILGNIATIVNEACWKETLR